MQCYVTAIKWFTQCVFYFNIQDEVECTAGQDLEATESQFVAELETEQPDRGVDIIQVQYWKPHTWNIWWGYKIGDLAIDDQTAKVILADICTNFANILLNPFFVILPSLMSTKFSCYTICLPLHM